MRVVTVLLLFLLGAGRLACSSESVSIEWHGRTMGSPYTIKLAGCHLEAPAVASLKKEIESLLEKINGQLSHFKPDSELSRFNAAPAGQPFQISEGFARVVRFSGQVNRLSSGAFDPTLAPVINLWGFGEKSLEMKVPLPEEIRLALNRVGFQHLHLTPQNDLIKDIPGLSLNFSAVAKGFAVDEIVEALRQHGHTNLYVSLAGDVRVLGRNARGTKWQIGIAAPVSNWREDDPMEAVVPLSDQAISTSGDYQKFFFDREGRRLSHLFDPKTGWPVQHNLGSVSVIASNSMTADALSTTLFVLGSESGLKLIESMTNAAALFILREPDGSYRQIRSSAFRMLTR